MGIGKEKCDFCWLCYEWACRIWGLLTALASWGVGVESVYYGHALGIYVLVIAFIVTYFETVFIMNYFVDLLVPSKAVCCLKFWEWNLWLDDWRKGLFYVILSLGCFVQPLTVRLALIAGGMLCVCGFLYSLKTVKTRRDHESHITVVTTSYTYDRFDELPDDADIDITNPSCSMPIMSVADQTDILEV